MNETLNLQFDSEDKEQLPNSQNSEKSPEFQEPDLSSASQESEQSVDSPKSENLPEPEESKAAVEPKESETATETEELNTTPEPEELEIFPASDETKTAPATKETEPSLEPEEAKEAKASSKPQAANVTEKEDDNYRVFARKYRPKTFDDLYGQDAMVKTLSNAFELGRIAQAWMLTGVRGVGKTTTARILARALNIEIPGEIDKPTIKLDKMGVHCEAIMEGRHVDVIEMDAASHTGINDIREITDSARYRPASARYKVFLIDEVHMLSNAAFNGLLKTLEEPPDHVKFIFATTEIRKVPVTILSRCQRFDLRRIDAEEIIKLLRHISAAESIEISDEALVLIARAGEGSARDSLSLLDQAVAHGTENIDADTVRTMMGLADRARIIDLIEFIIKGDVANVLAEFQSQYNSGADPAIILTDLADFIHLITRMKVIPDSSKNISITESERKRGVTLSAQLTIRILSRIWQILLKGIPEVQQVPKPLAAAEMVLVRLCYSADLPSPEEAFKLFRQGKLPDVSHMPDDSTNKESTENKIDSDESEVTAESKPKQTNETQKEQEDKSVTESPVEEPSSEETSGEKNNDDTQNSETENPVHNTTTTADEESKGSDDQESSTSADVTDNSEDTNHESKDATQLDNNKSEQQVENDEPVETKETENKSTIHSLEQIAALCSEKKDLKLKNVVETQLRPVSIEVGKIEIEHQDSLPASITRELSHKLTDWTGENWKVIASDKAGTPTLRELKETLKKESIENAAEDNVVATILSTFDGAVTTDVRKTNVGALNLATVNS